MKTYSAASTDLWDSITRMQTEYHPDLKGVTVTALFVHDEESGDQVLKLHGYFCAAVVSITSLKQRALGIADALIIVDRACWLTYGAARRDALIDHELQHLVRVVKEASGADSGGPVFDAVNRPKLSTRRHDHELGWFDEVARRHGEESMEVRQARDLVATTQQLYFDFAAKLSPRQRTQERRASEGSADGELGTDEDQHYPTAVTLVTSHRKTNISFLQNQLHIGYNRAARLFESMEQAGVVGPLEPNGSRKILHPAPGSVDCGWPRWSDDNRRYENKDGTPYEGDLGGSNDGGQTPMH